MLYPIKRISILFWIPIGLGVFQSLLNLFCVAETLLSCLKSCCKIQKMDACHGTLRGRGRNKRVELKELEIL